MVRCLFAFFVCLAVSAPSRAQSSVSGTYFVEPFVGRFFSSPIEDSNVFGARVTWRRSYSRTYYASFAHGGDSRRDAWESFGTQTRKFEEWSHSIGVVGIGSTLVDRDATGSAGLHVLAGIGYVSSTSTEEWETREADGRVNRSEFDRTQAGPLVDFALTGELELFSPRVLLRAHGNAYIGINVGQESYEGLLWLPGVSIAAGIAAGF